MTTTVTPSQAVTAVDRIASHAVRFPDALALVSDSTNLTFAELDRKANHLARRLRAAGVQAESPVALLLNRSVDYVIAALAVMKAGGAYLPMDPGTPAARCQTILKDSGAAMMLAHRCCVAEGLEAPCEILYLDAAALAEQATEQPADVTVTPENLAYIIYTSGSTGAPKGVEITHANLACLIDWHRRAFAVTPADRASHMAGLGFDASVWEIFCTLAAGATLCIAPETVRTSAPAFQRWLVNQGITVSFAPTILAQQLVAMDWPAESKLRVLLTGAEQLQQRPAADLPFLFFNNYGPTEATVVATSGLVEPKGSGVPTIGLAANGATIHILDEELCIAGPLVGRGYRNQPAMTAEKFVVRDGVRMYRTGDRARQLATGEIEFLGRFDDQVKIRGYRIEIGEVAAAVANLPGVASSAVTVVDDTTGEKALAAYIVPATGANPTVQAMVEILARTLPDYMIPASFVFLPSMPLTANGKVDYRALPAPAEKPQVDAGIAIRDQIAAIVAKLLKQPSVDPDANIFLLGGHSLLAAQMLLQVNRTFGIKLALRQMFQSPSVNALAKEVAKVKGN